ncbi:MAG: lysophospholipid acyltransferase family protein [Clostridia bacterium]
MFYRIAYLLVWLPIKIFFPTIILGRKNLPKGGMIFSCNHYSNLDVFIVGLATFRKQRFLGKIEIFANKCLGFIARKIKVIPVNRGKTDMNAVKESIRALKNNEILTVFPEGTRNKTSEEMGEIKNGIIMFALKAGKPIVPIAMIKRPKMFCFNKLVFGVPISLDKFYDQKITKEILDEGSQILTKAMQDLKAKYQK